MLIEHHINSRNYQVQFQSSATWKDRFGKKISD